MAAPSQSTRALAVGLAFLVSATSLGAALMGWLTRGELRVTRLVGGLLMLALGISGVRRLKRPPGGS